jgi:tRNA uracil 4-sulfurtransferase
LTSRFVAHYGEIGTKGANRSVFEKFLERNIRASLHGIGGLQVKRYRQRFFVIVDDEFVAETKDRLSRVFGLIWYAQVEGSESSYESILAASLRMLRDLGKDKTFRVSARRSDKSFVMSSQELARKLGEDIIGGLGLKVNLSEPDVTLYVDVIWNQTLLYRERLKGPGGLPVGTSGRVLHLLSGGIDSPVAAWLMMKRGCKVTYLHFYLAPGPQAVLGSKMVELVRTLHRYEGDSELILIPFAPYQLATSNMPSEYEPIVFRRFMRMVAERLAVEVGYPAISSGDNLAQVASQTLQNLVCIDSGNLMPTLRPLLGYDKDEIVQLAKKVGTYETSLGEYKDCCAIVSKHPRTRMKVKDVDEACERFDFAGLVTECISQGDVVTVTVDQASVKPLSKLLDELTAFRAQKITN